MKIWRLIAGALLAVSTCAPALSQQTKAQLNAQNNAVIVTNGVGAITGANLHPIIQNMINAACTIADPINCPITALSGATTPGAPLIGAPSGGGVVQGTRAGNTTVFGTVSGAIANGHCRSTDINGNAIDAGGACSVGGGGGTVSAASIPAAPLHAPLAVYTGTPGGSSTTVAGLSVVPPGNGGSVCANLEEFGGAGDNSTDNTAPMNNLLAAGGTNNVCLQEGSGIFLLNSAISYSFSAAAQSVSVSGAGSNNTILFWPTANNGIGLTYNSGSQTSHFHGLTFETGVVATGAALSLNNAAPSSSVDFNTIRDVTIRGNGGATNWGFGIFDNGVSFVNISGATIIGSTSGAGIGVSFEGNSGGSFHDAINLNITQAIFNNLNTGLFLGDFWQGVFISDTNFDNGISGIDVAPSATSALDQLNVVNTQFGVGGNSVAISSHVQNIGFSNDYFITGTGGNGIDCAVCSSGQIVGNKFSGNNSGAGVIIVTQTGNVGPGFTITGNGFFNLTNGIDFIAGGSGVGNIQSNSYSGVTTPVSPSVTTGTVRVGGGSN